MLGVDERTLIALGVFFVFSESNNAYSNYFLCFELSSIIFLED